MNGLRRVRTFKRRNFFGDLHAFTNGADLHLQIDGDKLLRADNNPSLLDFLKTGSFRGERVGAGIDLRERKFARAVAQLRARHVGPLIEQSNFGGGDRRLPRILHQAANAA